MRLPLMISLRRRRVVVVGGGDVARRKLERLVAVGARPVVVAPFLVDGIRAMVTSKRVRWFARNFAVGDVNGARLVVAATNCRATNDEVVRAARRIGALAVAADRSGGGGVSFAAVVERGPLVVAVATAGSAPALAAALRRRIEAWLPVEWSRVGRVFGRLRRRIKALGLDPTVERRLWLRLTDGPALECLLAGKKRAFAREVERCIASSSA